MDQARIATGGVCRHKLDAGNGFHHLLPLAHKYLGYMDLFGRISIQSPHAFFLRRLNYRLTPALPFQRDADFSYVYHQRSF